MSTTTEMCKLTSLDVGWYIAVLGISTRGTKWSGSHVGIVFGGAVVLVHMMLMVPFSGSEKSGLNK